MIKVYQIVNSIFTSNTFCITSDDSDDMWIVDCGDIEPIVEYASLMKKKITGVLLTHTHFDHIYGLNKLLESYPSIAVYTSEHGAVALKNNRLNMSHYNACDYVFEGNDIVALGNSIDVCGKECKVIPVPGHDPSCLAYTISDCLFTGDSYMPEYKVLMNFPKSNKTQAKASETLLKKIAQGVKVHPGHGNVVSP